MVVYDPKWKGERRYDYYHCTNGKRLHERQVNVSEDKILQQLGTAVDAIQITEDLASAVADALNETHRKAQRAKDEEIDRFRAELANLEATEDDLVDLKLTGNLDDETFRRQLDRVRQQRRSCTDQLQSAQREIDGAYLVTAQRVLELAKNAKMLWESRSKEERGDLLAKLLSNPTLQKQSIRFDLRKPYRILADLSESGFQRDGRDSNPRPPA